MKVTIYQRTKKTEVSDVEKIEEEGNGIKVVRKVSEDEHYKNIEKAEIKLI